MTDLPQASDRAIIVDNHWNVNYLSAAGGTNGGAQLGGGMNGAWLSYVFSSQTLWSHQDAKNWVYADGHARTFRNTYVDFWTSYRPWYE